MDQNKGKYRKGVLFLWAAAMCIGMVAVPKAEAASAQFSDIPATHWAKSGIDTAVTKGYIDGYPGGLFKPNANISRAEFIKMIVTAIGQPVETATGKWYESYVAAAGQAQLYTSSDFASTETEWNKKITRKEMARIAARATGLTTTEDDKWMYLATKSGLISGLGKGKLGEAENTTRAQSVAIVERVLAIQSGGTLPVDKYAVGSAELVWHGTNIFTVMPEIFVDKKAKENVAELWNEKAMVLTSNNGLWKGELQALIAIDLEDPNDPNLKEVPPISNLRWNTSKRYPVSKWMDSYLLLSKTNVIFNKDKDHYSNSSGVKFSLGGFSSLNQEAFDKGTLNAISRVYNGDENTNDLLIVPKKGLVSLAHFIHISIMTPAYSSYYSKVSDILMISGAE